MTIVTLMRSDVNTRDSMSFKKTKNKRRWLLQANVGLLLICVVAAVYSCLLITNSFAFNSGVANLWVASDTATTFEPQPPIVQTSTPKRFVMVPKGHEKTFFYDAKAISFPAARALRSRGWQRVDHIEDAHIVFRYGSAKALYKSLKPWQRYNHIPLYSKWNQKDSFITGIKAYQEKTGIVPYSIPESYRLNSAKERIAFRKRILQDGGQGHPWVLKKPNVNQGRGIEMIAPNSDRLLKIAKNKKSNGNIIQQYVCNEMTWNDRKFDVRMFWFVASLDPLVVLYQDGYTRIGNAAYREDNFDNTVSHLTTHTGLGEEGKATFEDFAKRITEHQRSSQELSHIHDPVHHVKSQFKESLAQFVAAFKDISFSPTKKQLTPQNGFGFYGADFILDNDLDVWLIEPQKGCGMDEDYDFRVTMHDRLFRGMVDTIEEIWRKQELGKPVLPLENIGAWEVIYADGWQYTYTGYERSKNKRGCTVR